jgi:hypothetical protein
MENLQNLDIKTKGSATPLDISSIPNFVPNGKGGIDLTKFRIRYLKLNLDELSDIAELEKIETAAIHNNGKYVISKKDFVFMDKIFILICYLEEIKE